MLTFPPSVRLFVATERTDGAMPVAARATPKIEIHVGPVSVCVREELDVEHLARIVGVLA